MKPYIKNTSKGTVFIFVRRVNSRNRKCIVSVPIKSSREYHFKSGDILDDQMISYYKHLEAAFGFIAVLPESESDAATEFKTPEGVVEPPTHSVIMNDFSKKNKKDKDKNKDTDKDHKKDKDKDKDKHDNDHLQDNKDFDPVDPDPEVDPDPDKDKDKDKNKDKDKDKDHDDNRDHNKHDNDDNPHNDQDHKDSDHDDKTEDPGQEDIDSESDEQSNVTTEDPDPEVDPEVLVTEDSTELEQQIDKKYNKDTLIQMCADFGIEGVDDKMLKADIIKILVENAADQILELVQQN